MSRYSTWIEIDIAKLRRNIVAIRSLLRDDQHILAMAKANAYGHGSCAIARFIADQVDCFGVANVNEAFEMREAGIESPLLILGLCTPIEYAIAIEHNVQLTVSSVDMARTINELSGEIGKKTKIHIKIDTGMGRLGLSYRTAYQEIQEIARMEHLELAGILTHFSVADNKEDIYTAKQLDLFEVLLYELKRIGIKFPCVHTANSSGLLNQYGTQHFTMVRTGLLMYGYYPHTALQQTCMVEPIMTLKSKVLFIKEIEAGKGVSYGRTHILKKKTRIAVLPLGYSHGVPYILSGKIEVLCKGKRYPIIGSICMDYTMVDIGLGSEIALEDEVIFIGRSGDEEITACDWAKRAGTIPYEILSGMSTRVRRLYVNTE